MASASVILTCSYATASWASPPRRDSAAKAVVAAAMASTLTTTIFLGFILEPPFLTRPRASRSSIRRLSWGGVGRRYTVWQCPRGERDAPSVAGGQLRGCAGCEVVPAPAVPCSASVPDQIGPERVEERILQRNGPVLYQAVCQVADVVHPYGGRPAAGDQDPDPLGQDAEQLIGRRGIRPVVVVD